MNTMLTPRAIGTPLARLDGRDKVTGRARYAFEHPVTDPLYLYPAQATIARGRITAIDTTEAEALPGVHGVITHANAPRLAAIDDRHLSVLQSDEIGYRGQFVAAVLATDSETARHAAELVRVDYETYPHEARLRADSPELYRPDRVNPAFETDTGDGDVDAAMAKAAVTVDQTYTTPMEFNNPMEPHTTVAIWDGAADTGERPAGAGQPAGTLTLYDSTQGVHRLRAALAPVFGLDPERIRVLATHVGGGFGAKGTALPHDVLAGLAARTVPGRPVRFALTRQQMYAVTGYRTPTIQRYRLGADTDGRLLALGHDVIEQTARIKEFAEQTAVSSRVMYAAGSRRTSHRLVPLDVPVPFWMRAPGEAPGMFAAEVAMDELAVACGIDPIELRVRNEPDVDPESGKPFSGRRLVQCLREGARQFDWTRRDPTPRARRRGSWLEGTGVAASTYPGYHQSGNRAIIRYGPGHRYVVSIGAVDIGTGAWTVLTQIAADALGVRIDAIDLRIGDTDLPAATVAGGSSGTSSWGSAITGAARAFRERHGPDPVEGAEAEAGAPDNPDAERFAVHSFGAQFARVLVDADTGEVRVPHLLGIFSIGRAINPRTVRSQLIGGMTMGLSMALHEESFLDPRYGHVVNRDLAGYHIATHADVVDIEAQWLDEHDPYANPMGARGIGEIGIVGGAAAIANAIYHATGIRIRDLPITADKLLT
jgi:xanthine dehydrogenase YagR molybdenum-binding subunit